MRVICEYQAYIEGHVLQIVSAVFFETARRASRGSAPRAMHMMAGEARTIEGRLSASDWLVGEHVSAADMSIFPQHHAAAARAGEARSRRPSLALPADGSELSGASPAGSSAWSSCRATNATYPPHWRDGAPRG